MVDDRGVGLPRDAAHRRLQPHPVAEVCGHAAGELRETADQARLLRTALDAERGGEGAGGACRVQQGEHRELARGHRHQLGELDVDAAAHQRVVDGFLQPPVGGERVPPLRIGCEPGVVAGDLRSESVEPRDRLSRSGFQRLRVGRLAPVDVQQGTAVVGGGEGVDAIAIGEGCDPGLTRPGPLPTGLDPGAALLHRAGAAADPVARLEDEHLEPGLHEPLGGREAREARTHHHDVDIEALCGALAAEHVVILSAAP